MGVTPHMGTSLAFNIFVITIHAFAALSEGAGAPSESDADVLLKFRQSLIDESGALASWNATPPTPPCLRGKANWVGVVCSKGGNIWGLRMENMKLSGPIDVVALGEIHRLRSASFTNNDFRGPIPDFSKLKSLKGIYLARNKFEGPIDGVHWNGFRRLRKLHLEQNKFSGEIPKSLGALDKLIELKLNGNQFQGRIPDFTKLKGLKAFNISNNQLEGPIPPNLAAFDPTSFAGNQGLCGGPMKPCPPGTQILPTPTEEPKPQPPPPNTNETSSEEEKPLPIIILIVGIAIAMILAILIILLLLRHRNDTDDEGSHRHHSSIHRRKPTMQTPDDADSSVSSRHGGRGGAGGAGGGDNGKLSFLREDKGRPKFDLPDLLKAAAEILGSGCFGSSYKATLVNGNAVVVKRFKQMNNIGREEFQEHMRRIGKLDHPNLLPLVAYYYRKEEKLFLTYPMPKGSLALLLHGQSRGKPTIDWPTRLRVIKGASRGLAELYKELPVLVAPHGHLKSSNVLLNELYEPVLNDYSLILLINQESAHEHLIAYKSPEYFKNGRVTKKTDVWSLGILILETLTGKFPAPLFQEGGQEVDMTSWITMVVEQGYDKSMHVTKDNEGEIRKLMDVAVECCETDVDNRLDIKEACERIEEIKERGNGDDHYSGAWSSRGKSEDFTVSMV